MTALLSVWIVVFVEIKKYRMTLFNYQHYWIAKVLSTTYLEPNALSIFGCKQCGLYQKAKYSIN